MITSYEIKELRSQNKEAIAKLSQQQQNHLDSLEAKINKKISNWEDLEKETDNHQLSIRDINATYESMRSVESQTSELFMRMKKIIGTTPAGSTMDDALRRASHLTRQGVVNIRPETNKDFDASELRIPPR
jgi:hypothetical protein